MAGIESSQVFQSDRKIVNLVGFSGTGVGIISEDFLNELAKGSLRRFILEAGNTEQIIGIWRCLIKTLSSASVSDTHRTTTCNVISGFLESSLLSDNKELRQFILSEATWSSTFDAYLNRFEDSKPKPMRQIITSLTKILTKHLDNEAASLARSNIANLVISNIILSEPSRRLRACINALEFFIRKDVFSATELITLIEKWLLKSRERWMPLMEEHCYNLDMPLDLLDMSTPFRCSDEDKLAYSAKLFTISLLLAAQNQEIASTAGMLFSTFCRKLKAAPITSRFSYADPFTLDSFWTLSVKYVILRNMAAVETISNHVLYPLFKADPSSFRQFVHDLPVQAIQSGIVPAVGSAEFALLFSALQIGKELGLIHEDCCSHKLAGQSRESDVFVLDSNILGQFLVHPEKSIRISVLSLLITAPSTTKPFPRGTLRVLERKLPYIHADSDPRCRGEILGLMRRLIIRLRGAVSAINKASNETALRSVKHDVTATSDKISEGSGDAQEHEQFLRWYIDFLETELYPTASYQRHISALRALILVLQSGLDSRIDSRNLSKLGQDQMTWTCSIEIFRPSLFRVLGDLLIDPFDDVREASSLILDLFPRDIFGAAPAGDHGCRLSERPVQNVLFLQLINALSKAEDAMARTGRADHADAVARLYHLLFHLSDYGRSFDHTEIWYARKCNIVDALLAKLERNITSLDRCLQQRAMEVPLHGYLSALRYIVGSPKFYSLLSPPADTTFSAWRICHERMLSLCEAIWLSVRAVLCADSPAGHEEAAEDLIADSTDLQSYSWRALRESSLLLHAILMNPTYARNSVSEGLDSSDFERMGSLSFRQLSELRHRGAFSVVSQTFASCCQRCGQSDDLSIAALPTTWYREALNIIDHQSSKLTRRSAGLPALITALALSKPGGPLFRDIMQDLHNIARQRVPTNSNEIEMKLPQVHALNCLKDIVTNTRLGPSTEPYITPALSISAECLGSPVWAIRNCGLMLFRALISRMSRVTVGPAGGFGDASCPDAGIKIPFTKYPDLLSLLSQLLESPASVEKGEHNACGKRTQEFSITTERIFPALELIGEKIPSLLGQDGQTLRELVSHQFRSPLWGIREQAARIYVSSLNYSEILSTVDMVSRIATLTKDQNHLHGILLCIRYALQRVWASYDGYWRGIFSDTLAVIRDIAKKLVRRGRSPFVETALINVLNDAMEISLVSGTKDAMLFHTDAIALASSLTAMGNHSLVNVDTDAPGYRSSSLLRRATRWMELIKRLVQPTKLENMIAYLNVVFSCDPDIGPWLLQRLHQSFRSHGQSQKLRVRIYIYVISGAHPQEAKKVAASNLADDLEQLFARKTLISAEFDFLNTWATSVWPMERLGLGRIWNRDMLNAYIRLQGGLLILKLSSVDQVNFRQCFQKWTQNLRFAIQDETDLSTRYSAVLSMKAFVCGLMTLGVQPLRVGELFLEVYLLLYDMVNDDEEELRDLAAVTASLLLLGPTSRRPQSVALVPTAVSFSLAEFLAENYANSSRLLRETIRRLLGHRRSESALTEGDTFAHISTLFRCRKESSALFAEEKQNLFIDETREAQIWANVLSRLVVADTDISLINQVYSWVLDGLSSLTQLTRMKGIDGIFGWMSNPEDFAMGIRIIQAAKVLLLKGDFWSQFFDSDTVRKELGGLLEAGRKERMHEYWLSILESTLDSNGNR